MYDVLHKILEIFNTDCSCSLQIIFRAVRLTLEADNICNSVYVGGYHAFTCDWSR